MVLTEEAFSGRRMPLSVFAGWITLFTRMRLNVGTRRFIISLGGDCEFSRVVPLGQKKMGDGMF